MNLEKEIEKILVSKPIYIKSGKANTRIGLIHKKEELLSLFKTKFKELVPEEKETGNDFGLQHYDYDGGYNLCRKEMLERLKEVRLNRKEVNKL